VICLHNNQYDSYLSVPLVSQKLLNIDPSAFYNLNDPLQNCGAILYFQFYRILHLHNYFNSNTTIDCGGIATTNSPPCFFTPLKTVGFTVAG
jgi:hypothetical protein